MEAAQKGWSGAPGKHAAGAVALIAAALVWVVIDLLKMAAHLPYEVLMGLGIPSLLFLMIYLFLGPWMQMGVYCGLTDSLRGGKMRKTDALMFRGRIRRAFSTRMLVRMISVGLPALLTYMVSWVSGESVWWLPPFQMLWVMSLLITRCMLVFIPPLQGDYPELSGWELCDRSRALLQRFGVIRLLLWTLPGILGYFACSALFWVCIEADGMPISMSLGLMLTALLTALPAMYTRAAIAAAYVEALRRENPRS